MTQSNNIAEIISEYDDIKRTEVVHVSDRAKKALDRLKQNYNIRIISSRMKNKSEIISVEMDTGDGTWEYLYKRMRFPESETINEAVEDAILKASKAMNLEPA